MKKKLGRCQNSEKNRTSATSGIHTIPQRYFNFSQSNRVKIEFDLGIEALDWQMVRKMVFCLP